jgi:hypothetical protein
LTYPNWSAKRCVRLRRVIMFIPLIISFGDLFTVGGAAAAAAGAAIRCAFLCSDTIPI